MVKISKRLKTIAQYIPENSVLADIGSDHAYLPVFAVEKGLAKKVIAGEIADGPYQSALSNVKEAGYGDVIRVRKGDGLSVIRNDDGVDCITIAGMGGTLIVSILEQGKEKLKGVKRIILQPNIAADTVRSWLINNNWELTGETIIQEDRHIYEILIAEPGDGSNPYSKEQDKEIFFGPFLLKEKNSAFQTKRKN